jgi:hypothetical protein
MRLERVEGREIRRGEPRVSDPWKALNERLIELLDECMNK